MIGPEVYTVKARSGSDKTRKFSSGDYIAVPVPDGVFDYGFKLKDKLNVEIEEVDIGEDGSVSCLRYSSRNLDTRHVLSIREIDWSVKQILRIPIQFTDHQEGQPFHGLEAGDVLVVEIQPGNDIRVFRQEDYRGRVTALVEDGRTPEIKKPVLVPFLKGYRDLFTNLTVGTGFDGQRFEIVPFDGLHRIFLENSDSNLGGSPTLGKNFLDVIEEFGVPRVRADRISIYWDKLPSGYSYPDSDEEIFRTRFAERVRVILPEKGGFNFETEVEEGGGGSWASFSWEDGPYSPEFDRDWMTVYGRDISVDGKDVIQVYVPTPRSGMVDGDQVTWFWD